MGRAPVCITRTNVATAAQGPENLCVAVRCECREHARELSCRVVADPEYGVHGAQRSRAECGYFVPAVASAASRTFLRSAGICTPSRSWLPMKNDGVARTPARVAFS